MVEWLKAPGSKLFSPRWSDFLPLAQKCHFRPFSAGFNRCRLDRLGREVTRVLELSIQVEYTSLGTQLAQTLARDRFPRWEDFKPQRHQS